MHTSPISSAHLKALEVIISAFDEAGIWYRATGGLAGNLYGSAWPLHDIDLDYRRTDWPRIEKLLRAYLISLPEPYVDDEFNLTMAKARIGDVELELCQLENCFVARASEWHLLDPSPERREKRTWQHLPIWTLPLEDLIHYKEVLGRQADLEDLKRIAGGLRFTETKPSP